MPCTFTARGTIISNGNYLEHFLDADNDLRFLIDDLRACR